jgi:CheY-like chemotaxis protein/anti-sigma regulatory factor (Ser/Thr protein kinase)
MRVRQILLNLVGNAVKFTESGGVNVHVSWNDGRARFEVEDTGPGVSADELPRLFEPFVQSESGQRTREGTGLGLALSRNLARLMNGDITVESRRGVGSKFVAEISLPEAIIEKDAATESRVARVAPGYEGTRILVVDDTKLNRVVLTTLLSNVGFDVREAANGEEALALWREWKPQLIWMDKRMPGMDGLEVTRRIRAEETSGHTPILALSASALDHERGEILAAGCDDFVAKPFREKMIFGKIREHAGVEYVYEDAVTPAPAVASSANGTNVLLVDDDWICREVATEILRGNGLGVTTASSGEQALDFLHQTRFDLVLMDLHMPDMGGVETTRRIRANPETARIPIIAMTADTFDGEATRLAQTGMDDYVVKPVEPSTLATVVNRWLPARSV